MSLFSRLFGKEESSGKIAKDRIIMVLMQDRADISPELMENMKRDIIKVIKKYVDIDEARIELDLERENTSVALVANIPVVTVPRYKRRV